MDLDFIKQGRVKGNDFINNGNDGLDLSGSSIVVEDNYFERSGDKCVSVGEKSVGVVIYNNVMNSCNIGVEIKDLSDIYIINNVIINNNVGFNAYEKKPVFGGGKASVYNSIVWNNKTDVTFDDKSEIKIFFSSIANQAGEGNFTDAPAFSNSTSKDFTINWEASSQLFVDGGNFEVLNRVLGLNLEKAPVGLNK